MTRKTRKAAAIAAALLSLGTVTAFAASRPPLIGVTKSSMNGVNRAAGANGVLKANAVGNRQIKFGSVSCGKLSADLVAAICTGKPGAPGTPGAPGANGSSGSKGDVGSKGTNGNNGPNGNDGAGGTNGTNGTNGASGVSSPLVYGPYSGTSTDSGCGNWAHDTWKATYLVHPESNGSFTVNVIVNGRFTTLEGVTPGGCTTSLAGGISGTFYGDYSINVPIGADYNPNGTAGAGTDTFPASGLGTATDAFMNAHFGQPKSSYAWQFHYATRMSTWDNTDHGNTGNITG